MTSFESLIKEIEKNRKAAMAEIPENADPRTLTTRIGIKKRAKQNLEDLSLEYRNHVKSNSIFMLPKGKETSSFVEIAQKDFGCFEVSADEIYNLIADGVDKRYYDNQVSSPALFDIFMGVFNDICDQVGILGYQAVLFESKYSRRLTSREELVSLIKEAFNDKVGSELVGIYTVDKVSRLAIEQGYKGQTIPIILHTEDEKLLDTLATSLKNLSPNVFGIPASKKQSAETVEKSLLKVRKQIK